MIWGEGVKEIIAIATMGSFGTYFGVLFFMRAFQTILLLLLAPLFLTLGRPLSMFIADRTRLKDPDSARGANIKMARASDCCLPAANSS